MLIFRYKKFYYFIENIIFEFGESIIGFLGVLVQIVSIRFYVYSFSVFLLLLSNCKDTLTYGNIF